MKITDEYIQEAEKYCEDYFSLFKGLDRFQILYFFVRTFGRRTLMNEYDLAGWMREYRHSFELPDLD